MSRRVRILIGLGGVVLVAGLVVGFVIYRDQARTNAVTDFKKSEPEFNRIEEAMDRLYRTVNPRLFGAIDSKRIRRAKSQAQAARVIKEEVGFSIQALDYPASQVNAVADVLRTADIKALTEVDHPALAGTSKQMRDAEKIGERNRKLIADIKALLPKYDALIDSSRTQLRLVSAFSIALRRGVGDFARISSAAEGKSILGSIRRKLIRSRNQLRKDKPAVELRHAHRVIDRLEAGILRDLSRLSGAIDRLDVAGAEAAGASIDRRALKASRDKSLSFKAVVVNSPLGRQLRRLQSQQIRQAGAYAELGE